MSASATQHGLSNVAAPLPQRVSRWQAAAVCLALAAITGAVFGRTAGFDFVNYDDPVYVYENPAVTGGLTLNGIVSAFGHVSPKNWDWVPLTTLSHMLDYQLYGLHPGGFHVTNVLLHTASVILLFLLLWQMTDAFWRSAFVAAIFAIHPLRVESVAWVTERKDVLSGLFFMLTIAAYLRFIRLFHPELHKEAAPWSFACNLKQWTNYGFVLLLFALGLMCKPMLVTLPFVLLLLDYWPLQRKQTIRQLSLEKLPLLALSAAAAVAAILAQRGLTRYDQGIGLPVRIGNALVSCAAYIGQMFYPVGLAVLYPHPGNHLSLGAVGLSILVLGLASVGVMAGRRKHPYLLTGWLWYLGMLVPVLGFIQAGFQARADRFTYLPQIGLYLMTAWGAVEFCRTWRWGRLVLGSTGAAILVAFAAGAYAQTKYWKDSVSLWTRALACTTNNYIAENDLGNALIAQSNSVDVVPYYQRALQIKPDYAEAHYNLAKVLAAQGKLPDAIDHYERALQLKPDAAQAHYDLGLALARQGNLPDAIAHYQRALQLEPELIAACNYLADALADQGKLAEAISYYEHSLHLKPDDASVNNNLGLALASQGKIAEAITHYKRAIQLKPDNASSFFNLGLALAGQGKVAEAIPNFQQSLQLATAQNKTQMADAIRSQLQFYESRASTIQAP